MSFTDLDLTTCDREKIHLISSVQGHGAFLGVHKLDQKIRNVSSNLATFFGKGTDSEVYIGKKLNELLPYELSLKIMKKVKELEKGPQSLEMVFDGTKKIEVHIFSAAPELAGVEFEFHEATDENPSSGLNDFLEEMQRASGLEEVSRVACQAIRFLTGFDRVMIYRFFPPTMYGEVIAEDRIASAQTFLRHRFPATDIPKPARDLYLKNKVRYIHDSHAENFEIRPVGYDKKIPLDMSDSRLRSVSLIHIEYLKNMGVRGSMSVAIIVDGSLWGIISCHHLEAQFVSQANRKLCLQVGNTLALMAPLLEINSVFGLENSFYKDLHSFFDEIKLESDPVEYIFRKADKLLNLFSSQGVALVTPNKVSVAGITPRSQDIRNIADHLKKEMHGDILDTNQLASENDVNFTFKEQASGILAVKVSPTDDSILFFMRPEKLESVLWGGDPRKNLEERNYNGKINPRASFETWTEVVKGTSLPWRNFEIEGLKQFRNLVFDALVRKELLIGELHERLKAKH
ncbi:MAG: GAF domain-containing protein [Bdellovibrionota bacterium]